MTKYLPNTCLTSEAVFILLVGMLGPKLLVHTGGLMTTGVKEAAGGLGKPPVLTHRILASLETCSQPRLVFWPTSAE